MIVFTDTIDQRLGDWISLNSPDKIVLVVSTTSRALCLPILEIYKNIDNIIYEIPDGDEAKTLGFCEDFWEVMVRNDVNRNSVVIALGGGAVLDFGGFAASVYMRGIPCIYIPTTLLSMVDGSEGGKTGINFYGTKNIIGTFTQPTKILRNIDFIKTLTHREILSGWAEIIKHGIIQGGNIWEKTSTGIPSIDETQNWMEIIRENVSFKQDVVSDDFREKGKRKLLNLGHTIGHGLEAIYFEDPEMTHGISVANGLYWEAVMGVEMGFTSPETLKIIEERIFPLFPKITWDEEEAHQLVSLLMHDKKNAHGKIQFTLAKNIGDCLYNVEVSEEEMLNFAMKHAVLKEIETENDA